MPKGMKPGHALRPCNAGPIERRIEDIAPQNIGMQRPSRLVSENEILRTDVDRALQMVGQLRREDLAEAKGAHAVLGFDGNDLTFPETLLDTKLAGFEIHVLPLEGQ